MSAGIRERTRKTSPGDAPNRARLGTRKPEAASRLRLLGLLRTPRSPRPEARGAVPAAGFPPLLGAKVAAGRRAPRRLPAHMRPLPLPQALAPPSRCPW